MTIQLEPQTLFNSLVERINAHGDKRSLSAFESASIKRDAERLKKVSPSDGYRILGMLACLERDVPELHKNHLTSIRLASDRQHALEAYAISLGRMAFDDEAVVQLRSAYEIGTGSLSTLQFLINKCVAAGRIREASRWSVEYSKLKPGERPEGAEDIDELLPFCVASKLADDDIAHVVSTAAAVARDSGVRLIRYEQEILQDPEEADSGMFVHSIIVGPECTSDTIVELTETLAEARAAETAPLSVATAVVASFGRIARNGDIA